MVGKNKVDESWQKGGAEMPLVRVEIIKGKARNIRKPYWTAFMKV